MSAPRPEGMTDEEFRPWLVRQIQACDEQMRAAKHQTKRARFADSALLLQGILQEFDRRQPVEVSPLREVMTDRFAMDDAKVQAYAKLELSDEAISRGWINWSDTAILACREIRRLRADGAALRERVNADRLLDSDRDELRKWLATANPTFRARVMKAVKPIGETVRIDVHKPASAPKEPTP